jgi:hypothetical protein
LRKELKMHKVSVLSKASSRERFKAEDKQDEADMIQNFIDQTSIKHFNAAEEAVRHAQADLSRLG